MATDKDTKADKGKADDLLRSPEGVAYQQPSRPQGENQDTGINPEKVRLEQEIAALQAKLDTFD